MPKTPLTAQETPNYPGLVKAVHAEAKARGISTAELLRQACDRFVNPTPTDKKIKAMAKKLGMSLDVYEDLIKRNEIHTRAIFKVHI